MRAMGLNVVRLGVMADGLFPDSSAPNLEYLDTIKAIVDRLWSHGFATIIDLHQDVRTGAGSGLARRSRDADALDV